MSITTYGAVKFRWGFAHHGDAGALDGFGLPLSNADLIIARGFAGSPTQPPRRQAHIPPFPSTKPRGQSGLWELGQGLLCGLQLEEAERGRYFEGFEAEILGEERGRVV